MIIIMASKEHATLYLWPLTMWYRSTFHHEVEAYNFFCFCFFNYKYAIEETLCKSLSLGHKRLAASIRTLLGPRGHHAEKA